MKYTEKPAAQARRNTHKWWKLVKKSGNGGYMHKIHLLSIKRGSCEWKFWFLLFVSWAPPQALMEAWSASFSHTHTPTFSISLLEIQGSFSPCYGEPLGTLMSSINASCLQPKLSPLSMKIVNFSPLPHLTRIGLLLAIGACLCSIGHCLSPLRLSCSKFELWKLPSSSPSFNGKLATLTHTHTHTHINTHTPILLVEASRGQFPLQVAFVRPPI